jgi:hypothetical protein
MLKQHEIQCVHVGGGRVAEGEEILQMQKVEAEFPCTGNIFSRNLHSLAATQ